MDNPASPSYVPTPAPVQTPPSAVPPSKPSSSKHVVWIVLAVVAVLAGAAYAWMQLNPAAPAESPSPSPTATADSTADWKTYSNTEYGFEVKYPGTINADSTTQSVGFSSNQGEYSVEVFDELFDLEGIAQEREMAVSDLPTHTLNDTLWYEFGEGDGPLSSTNFTTVRNGKQYKVTFPTSGPEDSNEPFYTDPAARLQILSTFKFTDPTAGWETYTNKIYGFEIQRPALGEPYDAVRTSISPLGEGIVFTVSNKDFPQGELKIESTLFCPEWSSYYLGTYSPCKKSEDEIFSTTVGTIRYSFRCYSEGGKGPGIPLSESSKAACGEIAKTFKTIPREPLSEWKTYHSEKYGFEFRYPPSLCLKEGVEESLSGSNGVGLFAGVCPTTTYNPYTSRRYLQPQGPEFIGISIIKNSRDVVDSLRPSQPRKPISINGIDGYYVPTNVAMERTGPTSYTSTWMFKSPTGYILYIEDKPEITQQILSTFRFTK